MAQKQSVGKVVAGEEAEEEEIKPVSLSSKNSTSFSKPQGSVIFGEESEEDEKSNSTKQNSSKLDKKEEEIKTFASYASDKKPVGGIKGEEIEGEEVEEMKISSENLPKDKDKQTLSSTPRTEATKITPILSTPPRTLLERKIVEKNEVLRRTLAAKVYQVYQSLNRDLNQVSIELNNSLNMTQDSSHFQVDVNDNLVTLSSKLPFANLWYNSFISGVDFMSAMSTPDVPLASSSVAASASTVVSGTASTLTTSATTTVK